MVRKLIRNQSLGNQLRVRLPCPPLSHWLALHRTKPRFSMELRGFLRFTTTVCGGAQCTTSHLVASSMHPRWYQLSIKW